MTIGELASRAGLAASTIRYYAEVKLLLREALRCGCVELDACGTLFPARASGGKGRP